METPVRYEVGGARKIAIFFRSAIVLVVFFCGLGGFWDGIVIFALTNFGLVVAARSFIVADSSGVRVRNMIADRWYSWEVISRFEAASSVRIIDIDGSSFDCWAVQRANIAQALGRVSRVDRVVASLEEMRVNREAQDLGEGARSGAALRSQAIGWLTAWEWVQVLLLLPAAGVIGYWVSL